jgi:tetratricopeptide (TPR) repeat protein
MRRETLICAALSVITLIGFWPVGHLGFILFDDHHYITENPNVQGGINAESVRWAFTTTQASNWHPITWLSHMLDYQWFGLNASGHHWVNLGFHIANTLLLFLVLNRMMRLRSEASSPQVGLRSNKSIGATTPQAGTVWCSALVAALFALHPMRVESVAWISERKDVLSGFFMMLTLWAWVRYVQKLASGVWCLASGDYWLALVFFALGLMSKPMLVTLPVILLLLDFWPLRRVTRLHCASARQASDQPSPRLRPAGKWRVTRFGLPVPQLTGATKQSEGGSTPWRTEAERRWLNPLLFEKLPFMALSLASCIVTFWAQNNGGAVVAIDRLPWYWRVADSLVFYTAYLGKIFWPQNLAIFYPYVHIPVREFVCSALLPILLSIFSIRRARSQPCLLAGWCWFLVMLLPVIGLVQVGMQSIADRYTYLPSIGLFIVVAWGMAGLASLSQWWRTGMVLGATGLILACLLDTRHQLHYWRNSVTLFSRAAEVTRESNSMSNYLLGNAYAEAGDMDAAARSFRTTLQIAPDFEQAHDQLGRVLVQQKKFAEAEAQFGEILRLNLYSANAHKHLGDVLVREGKYAEAEAEYSNALMIKPDDAVINRALAIASLKAESEKKLTNLYNALKILPTPETHTQIAVILAIKGEFQDAIEHYNEALRLRPDSPDVLNNLAWLLATCTDAHIRDGAQAVKHAGRACELTHYNMTPFVGTLAAAYAEAGRFDDAIATAQKACTLASKSGEQDLLRRNQELLVLYRTHQPYHEAP